MRMTAIECVGSLVGDPKGEKVKLDAWWLGDVGDVGLCRCCPPGNILGLAAEAV